MQLGEELRSRLACALIVCATAVTLAVGGGPASAATGSGTFVDDDGRADEADIEALAARGVTAGCGPGRFCPDAPVRRGEMAVFLQRALALPAPNVSWFVDVAAPFDAAADALATAGVATGCGGSFFCPDAAVTRGQMAVFLARAYGLAGTGTAVFIDVEDGHPYRDAIAALASAGITAGCGGTSFCPDAPVTRGQMATFLTRAATRVPVAGTAGAASACPAWVADARMVFDGINASRAAQNLAPVGWVAALDAVTTDWAAVLAAEAGIRHNPAFADIAFAAVPAASWVAENIGEATGADVSGATVDATLVASVSHHATRVNAAATHVSVGAVWSNDGTTITIVEGYVAAAGQVADQPPWSGTGC